MRLSPQEIDKLVLHGAGFLAQKRLARGLRLNYPEAVALIASVVLELIRDGHSVAELMATGRKLLGHAEVMDGVGEMLDEVQVEGTFPDGSKLVTVHQPIASEHGDLKLALYGSFLPVPDAGLFARASAPVPCNDVGEVSAVEGTLRINEGRPTVSLKVVNRGDRPIQVGSHYHFVEVNRMLSFDRGLAYGMRLDIPAGTAVRFEPGEEKTVALCAIAGSRTILGGNGLSSGSGKEETLARAVRSGFSHQEQT